MDPTTLVCGLAFLLSHPGLAVECAKEISRPSVASDVASLQDSGAKVSRGILNCYHPWAANYRVAEVVQMPRDRQDQYGADDSALIRIKFRGAFSEKQYEMTVAVLARNEPKQILTVIQSDGAPFPPSPRCQLARWTAF
jgi:hypothetical protein